MATGVKMARFAIARRQDARQEHQDGQMERVMSDDSRDRLDIMDVFNRYALATDRHDWDLMERLFLPDVVATLPVVGEIKGAKPLVAAVKAAIERLGPTHHMLGN